MTHAAAEWHGRRLQLVQQFLSAEPISWYPPYALLNRMSSKKPLERRHYRHAPLSAKQLCMICLISPALNPANQPTMLRCGGILRKVDFSLYA